MRTKWTTKGDGRRRFFLLMWSRTPSVSSWIPLWTFISASPVGRSSPIVFLRKVLSLFSAEKDRSTGTNVTGIHAAIFVAVKTDGKMWAPQKFKLSLKLWGRSSWLFSSQSIFYICSLALNVSIEAVEIFSGYLFRSVLQIEPASVLSSAMRWSCTIRFDIWEIDSEARV